MQHLPKENLIPEINLLTSIIKSLGDYPKKLSPNSPENNGSLFTNPPVFDDVGSGETDPNFCRIDNNVFHIGFPIESHNGVT
jgi:hypothetical protein